MSAAALYCTQARFEKPCFLFPMCSNIHFCINAFIIISYHPFSYFSYCYTKTQVHRGNFDRDGGWGGIISVPAHTGYIRPHTLIYLSCLSSMPFPTQREMGADEIYTCMRWYSFWEKHMQFIWQKRALFAPISILFTTMLHQQHSVPPSCTWESVMDVHVHIVSKY